MMLRTFLPKIQQRYAFVGSAIGTLIPAICYTFDVVFGGAGSIWQWANGHANQAVLLTMPVWMGLVFLQLGRSRARLENEVQLRNAKERQLVFEAHHDRLTGLENRLALEKELCALFAAKRKPALLLLDLDRFKYVNDSMGHDAGDELLVMFGQRLLPAIGRMGQLYRLGGDEFVILLPQAPGFAEIEQLCETVETLAGIPFPLSNGLAKSGVSIGITYSRPADTGMSTILKRADVALYKAKEIEGSSHYHYCDDLARESRQRMELEQDLRQAIQNDELYLHYQPIMGAQSRVVRSFEALLRWKHPVLGDIQPDMFIPTAERTGLILPIGNWVMRKACAEAVKWPIPTGVAVNVSGDQFKDSGFVDFVKACLTETGLAPGRLTIEVTESLFTVDVATIRASLLALRAYGVRIALDDFGVGFSSISHLRNFPVDQLKVDKSFTHAMMGDKRDADLIDIMLQLGATFDVATTIEGIETERQMDYVRDLGANEVQGFLFSRPVAAEDVIAFMEKVAIHPMVEDTKIPA
jgi:diguanylate cyclase (GGDEF)-like protein